MTERIQRDPDIVIGEVPGTETHTVTLGGEAIDRARHEPAVEPKGATYTELKVMQQEDGRWCAQCIVDV